MAKIALLIGVSEYEAGFAALPAAVRDVAGLHDVLIDPEMGGFDEVTMLPNPPRQEMEEAIYKLFAQRQKEDLLLLYFSGHGVVTDYGKFFLSTRMTRLEQGKLIPTSAVDCTMVHEWMGQSRSRRQVVILDSCFSGAFAKGMTAKGSLDLQKYLGGEGRAILTASTSTQYAFEQSGAEFSLYTRYLIEGMRTGAADLNDDGEITIDELHQYTRNKVGEAAPAMTPEFYPTKEGYRIIVGRSPKNDPKLTYRKEVESRVNQGGFSIPARRLLNSLRSQLNLTAETAEAIEAEILQPFLNFQRNLAEYEQTLSETLAGENLLSQRSRLDLRDYQQHLGLRDEDVADINAKLLVVDPIVIAEPEGLPEQSLLSEAIAEIPSATKETTESERQQLEKQKQSVQSEWNRRTEKLDSLRKALAIESGVAVWFELEQQIKAEEEEISRLGSQLTAIEQRLNAGSGVVAPTPKSPISLATSTFEFEVVTVDRFGKEIERRRDRATYFVEDLNGIPLEMVAIPGGTFEMGSKELEAEQPIHTVTVQPFYMGKFPVTQAQYEAITGQNPSQFKGANRPVETVSWNDAVEFCDRLSQKTGNPYRLPSEAEWEYSCRAGTTTPFYFGETITTDLSNYDGGEAYGHGSKGIWRRITTDVGTFPANAFGLSDMHGNVLEWCADSWNRNYQGAPTDGSVWEFGSEFYLLRGGSWFLNPRYCRSASRLLIPPDRREDHFGFRVVCSAPRTS